MPNFDDYLDEEEQFFSHDTKEARKLRKRAQNNDRSKYKKSNLKKETLDPKHLSSPQGRVLAISSDGFTVATPTHTYLCRLKGALKKEKNREKTYITIGDIVRIAPIDTQYATIIAREPRYSHLTRADATVARRQHLLAANIDQVCIVASPTAPMLKPTLIDRYIIAAKKGAMAPIVILNKIDLLDELDDALRREVLDFITAYSALDFPLVLTSAESCQGIEELRQLTRDKTSVLSGQSGVGKTSLINQLFDTDFAVQTIVERTQKGKHTTTSARLLPLPEGGFCIDTPGIKSFGLWDIEAHEVASYFPEIHDAGQRCAFSDCTHTHEPHCAVIDAVKKRAISKIRYHSYLSLFHEEYKEDWE